MNKQGFVMIPTEHGFELRHKSHLNRKPVSWYDKLCLSIIKTSTGRFSGKAENKSNSLKGYNMNRDLDQDTEHKFENSREYRRLSEFTKELREGNPEFAEKMYRKLVKYNYQLRDKIRQLQDTGCVCKGNLREIIKEHEPLFGKLFEWSKYTNDCTLLFEGIVYGEDDIYYLFVDKLEEYYKFSCVTSLENWGLKLKEGKY